MEKEVSLKLRERVSTKMPEVGWLLDKKQLRPSAAVLEQDADGSGGQNQREEAETL